MKKFIVMALLALVISSPAAFAEGSEKGKGFSKADKNGDGVVSKSEFLAQAEERFSKMDADGNGEISKDEGKSARKEHRAKMKERMDKVKEKRSQE